VQNASGEVSGQESVAIFPRGLGCDGHSSLDCIFRKLELLPLPKPTEPVSPPKTLICISTSYIPGRRDLV
jgi:hypothetical protein